MHSPIEPFLSERGVFVMDGALATELERRGADLRDPLWSASVLIEQPDMIRDVHMDYFRAGADVATTATYQATFQAFERRGIAHAAAAQFMRDAVGLAASARDEFWENGLDRNDRLKPLVAASVGPYGAMLGDGSEYRGRYKLSDAELRDFHRPRFEVLATSQADLLACETLPCLREALVMAELLQDFPHLTAWMSFSCQDAMRDCEGEDVADCAAALDAFPQIAALGVNCTRPEFVTGLLRRMGGATAKPLLAYPNSGEHYDPESKTWHGAGAAMSHAEHAKEWYAVGARLLGGCCRTTPTDIAAIRRLRVNGPQRVNAPKS